MALTREQVIVGLVWFAGLLVLLFAYPFFAEQALERIPYSFLLLAPFGWTSFSQWALVVGLSYWAIVALGWAGAPFRKAAALTGAVALGILMLHVAWVIFVVAKGGL
jgi:hypothetical protein